MLDQVYQKLGIVEMDDMAAGIRSLWTRPYVDKARVGIYGTSYGGYSAALSILKHPDVWTAASASSSVTSWHHYDSIYTERYMWIPQENEVGYGAGNAMNFAKNLKGRLLLAHGTMDTNVPPYQTMLIAEALIKANKDFDLLMLPNQNHGYGTASPYMMRRRWDFFVRWLHEVEPPKEYQMQQPGGGRGDS